MGGGGRYIGLMQISTPTAKRYACKAQSASTLKDGVQNLACAVEIFAPHVAADGMVAGGGNRGIGRDWQCATPRREQPDFHHVAPGSPWQKQPRKKPRKKRASSLSPSDSNTGHRQKYSPANEAHKLHQTGHDNAANQPARIRLAQHTQPIALKRRAGKHPREQRRAHHQLQHEHNP